MGMIQFTIRLIIQLLLAIGMMALYLFMSPSNQSMLILMLPMFMGIPAIIFTAIILAPAEVSLDRKSGFPLAYPLVPIISAAIPLVWQLLAGKITIAIGFGLMGLGWGGLWMTSRLIYRCCARIFSKKVRI